MRPHLPLPTPGPTAGLRARRPARSSLRSLSAAASAVASALLLASCMSGGAADSPGAGGDGDGGGGVGFGGAQDIGEFRGILERGELPGPGTLDANGFFNEHFAPPPAVACSGTLCITPGLSVGRGWLDDTHQTTVQVALTTNVDPADYTRLPMRLVVVVDHSGSMSSDGRLEKVKVGLGTLIDNLKDEDRLALISFDDTVTVDAPFAPALDRAALKAAVAKLQPRGSTNIFDGLKAGLDLLGDAPPSDRQNRVIFLSDGLATAGDTSTASIIAMATSRISRGIGLTTIGVGNEFDAPLMRGLAERGAGNFYYLEDATAAGEVFHDELDYFMSPLALELELAATTPAEWAMNGAVGSSLWRQLSSGSAAIAMPAVFLASRTGQAPDPGGGRRGGGSTIFVDMSALGSRPGRVVDLRLSYRRPGSAERITTTATIDYDQDPRATPESPYLSYDGMAERYAMYNMYLGLHAATEYASFGSYDCAVAALSATRRHGKAWLAEHEADQDLTADLALVDRFLANLAERGASVDRGLAGCPSVQPGEPPIWGDDEIDGHVHPLACAAGGNGSGWLAIAGVVLFAARRRRARR